MNHQNIEHNNAKLAYEYTATTLDAANKGIEKANQKLTQILASSGILLSFVSKAPSYNRTLLLSKTASCLALVVVVIMCLHGLRPQAVGDQVDPDDLLNKEWYYEEEGKTRRYIANQWLKVRKQLEDYYYSKTRILNRVYVGIGIAVVLFAANVWISTLFPVN